MRAGAYRVRTDRLGDILELLLAAIHEVDVQLAFDLAVHLLGNEDTARIGDPLQPNGYGDPVAVEDNVTKIKSDTQT